MAVTHLAEVLRCFRVLHEVEQRALAKQLGVAPPVLCRFEKGEGMPNGSAVARIFIWLMTEEE